MFVPGIDEQADNIDGATQARRWAPAGHAELALPPAQLPHWATNSTRSKRGPARRGPWPTSPNATSASWPPWWRPGSEQAQTRLRRMQYRPGLIGGFLATTGLDLTSANIHICRHEARQGDRTPW